MRAVSTHKPFDNPDQSRLCMWVLGTIPPPATRRLERIAEELTEVTGLELSEKDIRSFESKVPHSGFSLTDFFFHPLHWYLISHVPMPEPKGRVCLCLL